MKYSSAGCYYDELYNILKRFDTIDEQAEELEQYVRFISSADDNIGMTGDLLNTSLGRIDWYEIASKSVADRPGHDVKRLR